MNFELPVGYYEFHTDALLNFQLNRFYSSGLIKYEILHETAKEIKNFRDFKDKFKQLAEKAIVKDDQLSAAVYYRGAEFFALGDDLEKYELYKKCIESYDKAYRYEPIEYDKVPYGKGYLPVMKVEAHLPVKGTILLHGGYDSFIQEFYTFCKKFSDSGYNVIMFEGPGQGGALYDYGMHMIHDWEKPVSTVLDYYELTDVTLIGISLGGYLATRASAFDKRITRLVMYDLIYDYYGALLSKSPKIVEFAINLAVLFNIKIFFKYLDKIIENNLFAQWLILQGYNIFGVNSLRDYYRTIKKYSTKKISSLITQDVLVLAGEKDIYTKYFNKQINELINAGSVEGRIFTEAEKASHHCQIGNIGLALDYIIKWIDLKK